MSIGFGLIISTLFKKKKKNNGLLVFGLESILSTDAVAN